MPMTKADRKRLEQQFAAECEKFDKNFPKAVGKLLRLVHDGNLEMETEDGKKEVELEQVPGESKSGTFYNILAERDALRSVK